MDGFARVGSGTILGIDAIPVTVECFRGKGLPQTSLVGLARGAVKESVVRVRAAIGASELTLGSYRIVANLLPAEVPKDASSLDLALAVALLAATGHIENDAIHERRFFGELSLGGRLEPSRGAVLVADLVRQRSEKEIFVPRENAAEAALIPGVKVTPVDDLRQLVDHLNGHLQIDPVASPARTAPTAQRIDMAEVAGQTRAKRALEIAAAGGHNVLLIGPPGSGKTMLAHRVATLLPPLSLEESTEVTRIYSAAGMLGAQGRIKNPQFRSPHHTSSYAALCGGGSPPRPGEITLAHRGVLFLDELPEFGRRAIEALREPLEEHVIHISRSTGQVVYPAQTLMIAAMNPCPCGFYSGDVSVNRSPTRACTCNFTAIENYRRRVSGPVLDRIDMHIWVEPVRFSDTLGAHQGEPSISIRRRVVGARKTQHQRLGANVLNSMMTHSQLRQHVALPDVQTLSLLEHAMDQEGLTTRALERVRRIARTIADLEQEPQVNLSHLKEALSYRVLDRRA